MEPNVSTTLRTEIVSLSGSPTEAGRTFGSVSAAAIRRDVATFREARDATDLEPGEFTRRIDQYLATVDRVALHWFEEMAAIAEAAGVTEEDYTAHVAQKYVLKATRHRPTNAPHSWLPARRPPTDALSCTRTGIPLYAPRASGFALSPEHTVTSVGATPATTA
jgi:hypothetical protein